MGSSKIISNREIFFLVLMIQQSGLFWLLPYFLVRGNGTAGLGAVLAGILAAICIILIGHYWGRHMPNMGFVTALRQRHAAIGTITGLLFCLWYLLFAVLILYSFVDAAQKQLLPDTPRIVLCAVIALLTGWMSKGGLEALARLNMLCIGSIVLMMTVSIAGTADLFHPEYALPIQIQNTAQMQEAAVHSVFCYSSLLSVFMLYPASADKQTMHKWVLAAVGIGALSLIVWTAYALSVLGQYSLQAVLWIPIHLVRMVEIGALIDQTESLFIVLWMAIVMTIGSMFLWCASEGVHQLVKKQANPYLHWGIALLVFSGMAALENTMVFLRVEAILAKVMLFFLPAMLGLTAVLAMKRRERE